MANESEIIIEGNTATWELKKDGEILGTYVGKFRFRCFLTPTQKIAANREYRDMLGSNPTLAPEHESFLAYCLTQLKYRIIQAPPFWSASDTAGDVPDESILSEVLDAAVTAEVKFKKQLKDKKEEALNRSKEAAKKLLDQQDDDESPSEETDD